MTDHDDDGTVDDLDVDLIDKAFANLDRNDDEEVTYDELIVEVASHIVIDVEAERLRRARRLVANRRKPGQAKTDGQLQFEGMLSYDYEPDRLVLNDAGEVATVVENRRAKPLAKRAESRRVMKHAREVQVQAERRLVEASLYTDWAEDCRARGVKDIDITFGSFVRESDAWLEPEPAAT